jgi:hypothetical protein
VLPTLQGLLLATEEARIRGRCVRAGIGLSSGESCELPAPSAVGSAGRDECKARYGRADLGGSNGGGGQHGLYSTFDASRVHAHVLQCLGTASV